MPYCDKDETAEKEIIAMEEKIKSKHFEESYIRKLVADQKGELCAESIYYKGNIAEGNWSLVKKDSDIEKLDREEIEDETVDTFISITKKYPREKDAEYTYVFKPSYYAVKTLILYYLDNRMGAQKIYGLKNAVVRRDSKKSEKFYGGLPFVLKYIKEIYLKRKSKDDSIKFDFADVMQKLLDCKNGLEINNVKDDFINDIIDCIKKLDCGYFILDRRIKDFEDAKKECYCINFKEELKQNGELLNYTLVNDYNILMHRDVKNDWYHLQKDEIKKANEIINNTPNFPRNVPPRNDPLEANIKGWFSQKVSKKDRVVYKKESKEKTVYIATVCDHYKDAARRAKSTTAYK